MSKISVMRNIIAMCFHTWPGRRVKLVGIFKCLKENQFGNMVVISAVLCFETSSLPDSKAKCLFFQVMLSALQQNA